MEKADGDGTARVDRRSFLSGSSTALMAAGLAGGYGMFCHVAGRFLYPAAPIPGRWLFAMDASRLAVGESFVFKTPGGASVSIARRAKNGDVSDYVALGSVCPHLGCYVHWERQNSRFFCPCHNGAFDAAGKALSGPPAEAGQSLPQYQLKLEGGLVFIQVAEALGD